MTLLCCLLQTAALESEQLVTDSAKLADSSAA